MTGAPAWLRVLVRALPRDFRDEYEVEIIEHVAWMRKRRRTRLGSSRLIASIVIDVLGVAVKEHLQMRGVMQTQKNVRRAGFAAMIGGLLALAITPLMVLVKYSTGWSVIPPPAWEGLARLILDPFVSFATPVQLWMLYGAIYSVALLLMLTGVLALRNHTVGSSTAVWRIGLWVLLVGLCVVLVGDALHSATWHMGGATLPRPGLNSVATLGMSMIYLGMPVVFITSFVLGVSALRQGNLPRFVALLLLAVGPGGAVLTATQVPTMPSGALTIFSVMMVVLGHSMATRPVGPLTTP